jgi:hypothetical protein
MQKIQEKASFLKKGAFIVTLTKKLPAADPYYNKNLLIKEWECLFSIKKQMSWGKATVNVHRKCI